ncbi:hypothetical protein L579_1168 [Pantoea sp. AS-PWVM4]|nr:hypothetical protein L579_1168 [Pantoea sp. AS-PWVM4]
MQVASNGNLRDKLRHYESSNTKIHRQYPPIAVIRLHQAAKTQEYVKVKRSDFVMDL